MPIEYRRTQLIESALDVAAAEGIAATTVRRVADQAGVALGVVHYCFADKDELFAAMAARIVDELAEASASGLDFGEAPVRADGPPDLATALHCAVAALWDTIEATPGEQLLTYEITTHALRNAELRSVALRQYQVSQAAVERLLGLAAAASGASWTRPVPELAGEVLAYVDGVTLRWLVDRDGGAARARLASYVGFLASQARRRRVRVTPVAS